MKRKIVAVEFEISHSEIARGRFFSSLSLQDYDIAIFQCPCRISNSSDKLEVPQGTAATGGFADNYFMHAKRWMQELSRFLTSGGIVFVLQSNLVGINREPRGSQPKLVSPLCFIPNYGNFSPIGGKGNEIFYDRKNHPGFAEFYNNFSDEMEYYYYFEGISPCPFVTRKGKVPVSLIKQHGTGFIVLLPALDLRKGSVSTPLSVARGDDRSKIFNTNSEKFLSSIVAISNHLGASSSKEKAPTWVKETENVLTEEAAILVRIDEITSKQENLLTKLNQENEKLEKCNKLKALLYATGTELEISVSLAMKHLGYEVTSYHHDDLQIDHILKSPEGRVFICETEGKEKKQVNIDKLQQLNSNIDEMLKGDAHEDSEFTGILFGNAFRLEPPQAREGFFSKKCIRRAEQSGIILVETTSLFQAVKSVLDSNSTELKAMIRQKLESSAGSIVKFPEE